MGDPVTLTVIILILVSILFFVASVNSKRVPEKKREKIYSQLKELEQQATSEEIFARRDAVIKLDNLLSKALQVRYRNDKSCGENLKLAKNLFVKKTYQRLWDVHKLRNDIVHRDLEVSEKEAKEAYHVYKLSINKVLK